VSLLRFGRAYEGLKYPPSSKEQKININPNIKGITVPNSGHYIPEEQPDVVVKLLNNFFSGNSTTT
jgi:pimeloyl-ACP methyl ester carboxylesterase